MQTETRETQRTDPLAVLRHRLEERRAVLRRRLRRLDPQAAVVPEVRDLIETARRIDRDELGRVGAALRRFDNHEIDCCMSCGRRIEIQQLERSPFAVNCAACALGFPSGYAARLRLQHGGLRRRVGRLCAAVQALATARTIATADSTAVCEALGDLACELQEHFEEEERGGYLADVLKAAPRLSGRARVLESQHRSLLAACRKLAQEVDTVRDKSDPWTWIASRIDAFCRELIRHEQQENALIGDSLLEDHGGGD